MPFCDSIWVLLFLLKLGSSWLGFLYFGCMIGIHIIHWIFYVKFFMKILGWYLVFFMLVNLRAIFCDVLVMLCLMFELFASYRVSVSRYFAALCWVQHSYHSYIREVTCCGIFWWFYRSPSLSLSHSSCFLSRFDFTSMIQTDAPAFLWY